MVMSSLCYFDHGFIKRISTTKLNSLIVLSILFVVCIIIIIIFLVGFIISMVEENIKEIVFPFQQQ